MSDLTPEAALDGHFRSAVLALSTGQLRRADATGPPGNCPDRDGGPRRCSMPRWAAGCSISRRDGCGRPAAATTRSGRPATRPTPRSRPLCARPIRRCCTTAPAPSIWRGRAQVPGTTPLRDVLLGLMASVEDPIAGGRHKVFGRHELAVIPQTSTIASHLPRAVGVAFAIDRARKLGGRRRVAAGRDRGDQLRRRIGEPLDRDRRDQRGQPGVVPRTPDAGAVRLRGQRSRDQRSHSRRLDRGGVRQPAVAALFQR